MTNEKKIFEKLARMKREGKLDEYVSDGQDAFRETVSVVEYRLHSAIGELSEVMTEIRAIVEDREVVKELEDFFGRDYQRYSKVIKTAVNQWDSLAEFLSDDVYDTIMDMWNGNA